MDVRAVKFAATRAAEWCRAGNGPMILEMQTYRYRGHSMSDPAKYRSKDEVQKMREEHDPIEQVRARLLASKQASEDDLKKIDAEVRAIIAEAAEFATHAPEPDPAELWTDVCGVIGTSKTSTERAGQDRDTRWRRIFSCPRFRRRWNKASSPNG